MIVNEHIITYLHSLETDNGPFLEEMRSYAEAEDVPVIRREMESFIRVLLALSGPETVLEIGTGIAYSAIFMAENSRDIKKITTIENYPPRIEKSRENISRYLEQNPETEIELLAEDAAEAVKRLEAGYDLIFLDGPKGQYIQMFPDLLRLLNEGGVLLADNVLQDGDLVRSRFVTQRRERTVHERMREFVWTVCHHEELETAAIPIGDGVTVSMKKKKYERKK